MSVIYRGKVCVCGDRVSPAYTHSSRVAIAADQHYYIASNNNVYCLKPTFPPTTTAESDAQSLLSKTGIPVPVSLPNIQETTINTPHKHEIQTIVYDAQYPGGRLGVMDSLSNASITISDGTQYTLSPASRIIESGWAAQPYLMLVRKQRIRSNWNRWVLDRGLAFNAQSQQQVVTAHMFSKSIAVYDADKVVYHQYVANYPTAISVHPSLNLLLSLEQNQLAVYDLRDKASCVKRLLASSDWLYGIGVGADGSVGVGGATRTLTVYDPRKWGVRAAWPSCLKHEIRTIHFSHSDASLCYVGGLDAELIAGKWEGSGGGADHFTCLRVDSRWIGVAIDSQRDALFGCTAAGSVYFINDARQLYIKRKEELPTPHHNLDVTDGENR